MATSCKFALVVLVFQLQNFKTFQYHLEICHSNNGLGRCVDSSLCPKVNASNSECRNGKICCIVLSKIVTPSNAQPAPPASASSSASPSGSPPASPSAGAPSPPSGSPPAGASPPSSAPPAGASPPSSGPPAGASPPSSGPPAGASPPSASAGSPSLGSPPAGPPPAGGPPNGGPPPLMGNIVVDPNMSSPDLESIVVSSEDVTSAAAQFDQRCEMYNSMVEPKATSESKGLTPVVMIFGGTESLDKEFPHMAALGYGSGGSIQWLCGGSLITQNFVLTAAHCLAAPPLGEVRLVKLGSIVLNQDTPNTQTVNVIKRIPHQQYDSRTQYYDIALLQLDRSVNINTYVVPVCLFSSINYEDKNLIATGWGRTEAALSTSTLRKVALELFSHSECQQAYSAVSRQQLPLGIQENIQLCAGSHYENKDTCQGDSGGPLQIRKNNRWYLVGITSVGLQCGVSNIPGIYTRIAPFLPWIQEYVFEK